MEQPGTYHDWRRLWHHLARELGWHMNFRIRKGLSGIDKRAWRLSSQMDRVQARLQVEAEAGTLSYCQAMYEALQREGERKPNGNK